MKCIVLLSGGQDSTCCLHWAKINFDEVVSCSVNYGQRHAKELDAARTIAEQAGVPHHIFDLSFFSELVGSDLVQRGTSIAAHGGLRDTAMPEGLPTSFVPGRNVGFLLVAAALGVRESAKDLVIGTCQTDYSGYPDCRREFIDSMQTSLSLAMPSSCGPFRIHTPLMWMTKAETVRLARRLPGCWESTAHSVTCYEGGPSPCGRCPACQLRAKGYEGAGEHDPALSHGTTNRAPIEASPAS